MLPEARGALKFYKDQLNNGKVRLITEKGFGGQTPDSFLFSPGRDQSGCIYNGGRGRSVARKSLGVFKRYPCPVAIELLPQGESERASKGGRWASRLWPPPGPGLDPGHQGRPYSALGPGSGFHCGPVQLSVPVVFEWGVGEFLNRTTSMWMLLGQQPQGHGLSGHLPRTLDLQPRVQLCSVWVRGGGGPAPQLLL